MKPRRKANHGTREKGALWPIRDRARLRKLVKNSIKRHRASCKSVHVAPLAKACGLTPSWLNNYLATRNDPHEIQLKTWLGLAELVGKANAVEFDSLFMPDRVRETLGFGYRRWLQESDRLASEGTGYRWQRSASGFSEAPLCRGTRERTARDDERDRLWDIVRAKWPTLADRFDAVFEAPDWSSHRNAALTRVLEPFLQSAESGYVMRSWNEFHPTDRRELVSLGIRREELLRPGSIPWARMAKAAGLPLADFVGKYGVDKEATPSSFEILTEHDYGSRAR